MTQPQPAEKVVLEAQARETFGKQTRKLRKEGMIPANVFGKSFTSVALSVDAKVFNNLFKSAGETTVIYIKVGDNDYPTLVSDIQYHPVTEEILHVDFRKVNLKQKVEARVPIHFIGESEAVERKNGVLLTQVEEVVVSALPTNIPHAIEVDISVLKEIGDAIRVSDLAKSDTYEVDEDPEMLIVSVTEHVEEEIEPETTTEAPEILTEKEGEEGAEGEGAAPAEAGEKEEK